MKAMELMTVEKTGSTEAVSVASEKNNNRPRFTGRRLVVMKPGVKPSATLKAFAKKGAMKIASIKDFSSDVEKFHQAFNQGDGIYFDIFDIAVINEKNSDQVRFMAEGSNGSNKIISNEPERYVYALPTRKITVIKEKRKTRAGVVTPVANFTWATTAIQLPGTLLSGKGVNVAILDTGLNLTHPDFRGINILSKSFIKNQQVEDKNGHGTHCSGIAVGAIDKANSIRYGVAPGANLFIGKVLSNAGSGDDSGIIAGIEWAIQNKCKVISMSLGSEVQQGETFSPAYERIARTAISKNCVIVAAAGNESERQFGLIKPVGHPANCPSIMAVAAIDNNFNVASFSCGGLNPDGGQVDISAPGVNIYSSWKSKGHNSISGTSMATPFVAGVAALLWEAFPGSKSSDIWMKLVQNALRLNLNTTDIGSGLVQVK